MSDQLRNYSLGSFESVKAKLNFKSNYYYTFNQIILD